MLHRSAALNRQAAVVVLPAGYKRMADFKDAISKLIGLHVSVFAVCLQLSAAVFCSVVSWAANVSDASTWKQPAADPVCECQCVRIALLLLARRWCF